MKKTILALLIFSAVFSGCKRVQRIDDEYPNAVKMASDTRYYNDFLGISYSVPKDWWVYDLNRKNFNSSKGSIKSENSMDIRRNSGDKALWLVSFGNFVTSAYDNHLGFNLDAQSLRGINGISGFMKYYEDFMLRPTSEEVYRLVDSKQLDIGGKSFELRDYFISRVTVDYSIMTLSCEVKNGYYFSISVDYWPANKNAQQQVIDYVTKSIEFY